MVKALPDEKASDLATARQSILVHINSKKTTVSLIVHPFLILIGKTCRVQSQGGIKSLLQSAYVVHVCVCFIEQWYLGMVHHQYGKRLFHNLLRYYAATPHLSPD